MASTEPRRADPRRKVSSAAPSDLQRINDSGRIAFRLASWESTSAEPQKAQAPKWMPLEGHSRATVLALGHANCTPEPGRGGPGLRAVAPGSPPPDHHLSNGVAVLAAKRALVRLPSQGAPHSSRSRSTSAAGIPPAGRRPSSGGGASVISQHRE